MASTNPNNDLSIVTLRKQYHRMIVRDVLRITEKGFPNIADSGSKASKAIAHLLIEEIGYSVTEEKITGQSKGNLFEQVTRSFLENAFTLLAHIRPGQWSFGIGGSISQFEQYKHLAYLQGVLAEHPQLTSALGSDYLVTPDIVVVRWPLSDDEINRLQAVVDDTVSRYSPLRETNRPETTPLLHASISCKWTLRSDRGQNARTEALNLIRNRKGHTPYIVAVTAEPLPTRLASLALGTGDLDCTYHFALPELCQAVETVSYDQFDMLMTMVDGNRLRDISDLPLDLAI